MSELPFDLSALPTEPVDDLFDEYYGPVPPRGTLLEGHVRAWLTTSKTSRQPLLKVLFTAHPDPRSSESVFNGCTIWDDIPLQAQTAFRWHAWVKALGLTPLDLIKRTKCDTEVNIGHPIISIGRVHLADILVRVRVGNHDERSGAAFATVGKWVEKAPLTASSEPPDNLPF